MEFFKILEAESTETALQKRLSLDQLESFSNLLFPLSQAQGQEVVIGGLWGEFHLERSLIKGGLRFALRECPNALAWTITTGYPPAREKVIIHLTINRQQKAPEFLEEIEEFLDDHAQMLVAYLQSDKTIEA